MFLHLGIYSHPLGIDVVSVFAPELLPKPHRRPNQRLIDKLKPREACDWIPDPATLDFVLERIELPAHLKQTHTVINLCEGPGVPARHLEVLQKNVIIL